MDFTIKQIGVLMMQSYIDGAKFAGKDIDFEDVKIYMLSKFAAEAEIPELISAGMAEKECYSCRFKKSVPGNSHISCSNPDPKMTGDSHGIKNGWFMYPVFFDPSWKTKMCSNVEKI